MISQFWLKPVGYFDKRIYLYMVVNSIHVATFFFIFHEKNKKNYWNIKTLQAQTAEFYLY